MPKPYNFHDFQAASDNNMAEEVRENLGAFADAVRAADWSNDIPEEFNDTKAKAETLGWYSSTSLSQFGLTDAGIQELAKLAGKELAKLAGMEVGL